MFLKIFLICLFIAVNRVEAEKFHGEALNSLEDLKYDDEGHLAENYLLISDNDMCSNLINEIWLMRPDFKYRTVLPMSNKLHDIFPLLKANNLKIDSMNNDEYTKCNAVSLDIGCDKNHIIDVIPENHIMKSINNNDIDNGSKLNDLLIDLRIWIHTQIMQVEVGFLNWHHNKCKIYWIDMSSKPHKRIYSGDLHRKEKNTQWQTTTLGHKFEVVDYDTNEILGTYIAKTNSIHVVGAPVGDESLRKPPPKHVGSIVKDTFTNEWRRAHRVTRTFTELGFMKGKLPIDLYTSMRTYYYNNRDNIAREEWEDKGLFVNWYEKEAFMICMPWKLKSYWQTRLKVLVEAWSGVKLELTDIYGMRRYEDGARLLTHVDREQTHAASLIVNIAQIAMREPWMLEIYDFAGRLHEVEMDEGDIVYYESARCLHGRMRALHGKAYINLFAHYRPIGDPNWFMKSNPIDNPEQCIDINSATDDIKNIYNQYISPSGQTLTGPETLWNYWVDMGHEAEKTHQFQPVSYFTDNLSY